MRAAIDTFLAWIQAALPQHALTALVHRLMRVEVPWVKNTLITVIGSAAGVDWTEASSMDLDDYATFNAFFTRELRPGVRPVDPDPASLVSPCDGRISAYGPLREDRVLQAKGHDYSLAELLASDPASRELADGYFWTLYLSPRDYHRVHMPLQGELRRMAYVPGSLFSVSAATVRAVPGLFVRNERVISLFETAHGPMAQVLVGALLVGSVDTVWAGTVTPEPSRSPGVHEYPPGSVKLARGEEMGRFNMGSTVIVVVPPGAVIEAVEFQPGEHLRLGQRLATMRSRVTEPADGTGIQR